MLVRMVCGAYGLRNEDGGMEVKDAQSAPFGLDEAEGERLVRMGYAVRADGTGGLVRAETMKACLDPEELKDMSKKELEKLAKDMGLISYGTKEELIARIASAEIERDGSDDDGKRTDGAPDLKPAEPEG